MDGSRGMRRVRTGWMHEVDVGGPNPGSFTVGTPDVYGEAPLLAPMKIS